MPKSTPAMDGRSFTHSPRILGGNVHSDPLFQFYYNAALISFQCGIGPRGMTGPSDTSTISGFTQGGGPDLLSAVTGVALSALKAGWWHKWQQAMRIRPEAVGGLLEFCKNNLAKCDGVPGLRPMYDEFRQGLKNMTLAFTGRLGGSETLLLAMQYPECSPTHPAWPAGHATVAGASVTVLKAMLKTHGANSEKLPWPTGTCTALEARSQEALSDYDGADKGDLTIVGELNKLASNAALGRNFAGVHFRSDGDQGLAIGEQIAIQYLESKLQEYALKSALNSFTLEKFDGTIIEITALEPPTSPPPPYTSPPSPPPNSTPPPLPPPPMPPPPCLDAVLTWPCQQVCHRKKWPCYLACGEIEGKKSKKKKKKCKEQCELSLAMCKRSCIACDTGILPPTL